MPDNSSLSQIQNLQRITDDHEMRLREAEKNQSNLIAVDEKLTTLLADHKETLWNHEQALFGSGSELGLKLKVDRLDQNDQRRAWLIRSIIGCFLTIVASVAVTYIVMK